MYFVNYKPDIMCWLCYDFSIATGCCIYMVDKEIYINIYIHRYVHIFHIHIYVCMSVGIYIYNNTYNI